MKLPLFRKSQMDKIESVIASLTKRMGEQRVDYAVFDTSKPLDKALFTYLGSRQRFNRVR